ncbi:hypothetical protein FOZ60_007952 [Perkinsus olseni]|uniref:Uncharacterized protein n=1 Tax=Perkinsus olseni TaxID=32597 RepID=A0A7J6NKE2_PEROL|nr:hypothetical protein FOZ60_007952 [Perkinsus olseni]
MMDLSSTRWLVALVPVAILTEAQHFGTFVHETAFYTMTYDVEENYEVTFGFNVTVQPSELYPDAESSSFEIGPFSLRRVHRDAFTVDFEGQEDSLRNWYLSMEKALIAGRLDCMNPPLQLSVGIESESHVGIAATCGWRYTPYVRFNLERRSRTLYDHYDVVPAGEVTLEEFRQMGHIGRVRRSYTPPSSVDDVSVLRDVKRDTTLSLYKDFFIVILLRSQFFLSVELIC